MKRRKTAEEVRYERKSKSREGEGKEREGGAVHLQAAAICHWLGVIAEGGTVTVSRKHHRVCWKAGTPRSWAKAGRI